MKTLYALGFVLGLAMHVSAADIIELRCRGTVRGHSFDTTVALVDGFAEIPLGYDRSQFLNFKAFTDLSDRAGYLTLEINVMDAASQLPALTARGSIDSEVALGGKSTWLSCRPKK